MKKQLLFFVMMMLPMVASADPVEIDGIYYNLITKAKVAEVTSDPLYYTGSIVIPETVNYNNVTYSVTSIQNNAFQNCTDLTSVTIPNSVTSIGNVATDGSTPTIQKCETPTISFENGQLSFASGTDGAEFVYEITESVKDSGTGSNVKLGNTTTYHVSVYATKDGYEDSEVATKDITLSVGLKGDVNDDGKIDVEDVVGVVNIILDGSE